MKKLLAIVLVLFISLASLSTKAQTLRIDTTQISFENELRPAIGANVDPEPKPLKKAWAHYLKKKYDIKMKGIGLFSNKKLLQAHDVRMDGVSAKRLNLYTRITETSDGSVMKVFASYGYDIFIDDTNYPAAYDALQTVFKSFLLQHLNDYYSAEIKATSKRISHLKKDKIRLQKSIAKNERKLKKLGDKIADASATENVSDENKLKEDGKRNKLISEKTKLENDNRTSAINIEIIDSKLVLKKAKLEKSEMKHENLN